MRLLTFGRHKKGSHLQRDSFRHLHCPIQLFSSKYSYTRFSMVLQTSSVKQKLLTAILPIQIYIPCTSQLLVDLFLTPKLQYFILIKLHSQQSPITVSFRSRKQLFIHRSFLTFLSQSDKYFCIILLYLLDDEKS